MRCCTRFLRDDRASLTLFQLDEKGKDVERRRADRFLPFGFRCIGLLLFLRGRRWISADGSMGSLVEGFELNEQAENEDDRMKSSRLTEVGAIPALTKRENCLA